MSQKQFFKEGKWLPSFLLFGHRELVYHRPITSQGQHSSIRRKIINQSYPAQQYLASRLCNQTYELTKALRNSSENSHNIIIAHLRNMMSYVVRVQTQCYHNIIYLTLKYLAYLVTKEATQQSIALEEQISLESWLADIHTIYFQTGNSNTILPQNNSEQELLSLLMKGDYQATISKLRCLYCITDKQDKQTLEKIDFLITILLIKINNKTYSDLQRRESQEQFISLNQKLMQTYKEKYNKVLQGDKKQGNKKTGTDSYAIICKVLMGDEETNLKISNKSWPIYIMNHLNFRNAQSQKLSPSSLVFNFITKSNHYGKASIKQTQYLLKLLGEYSSHQIYQSLFELVPPFYAHLIGYFLSFIQPNPIATVFVEDYTLDIIRNLLDHSSQISFQCLILIFANFQQTSISPDKLSEIVQPLLVQHLCVMDDCDRAQINSLLLKVKLMSKLKLQRYVYSQLNLLLNNVLQRGVLNRQVLLIYAYCSMLFYNYYNYEELLAYYLEQIFISRAFNISFIEQYQILKSQLQSNREKKLLDELNRVEPLFDRFFRLEKVIKQPAIQTKIKGLIDLIQKTYRSVTVLQLIYEILKKLNNKTSSMKPFGYIEANHRHFLQEVSQFLTHYPSQRGEQESSLMNVIEQMIH